MCLAGAHPPPLLLCVVQEGAAEGVGGVGWDHEGEDEEGGLCRGTRITSTLSPAWGWGGGGGQVSYWAGGKGSVAGDGWCLGGASQALVGGVDADCMAAAYDHVSCSCSCSRNFMPLSDPSSHFEDVRWCGVWCAGCRVSLAAAVVVRLWVGVCWQGVWPGPPCCPCCCHMARPRWHAATTSGACLFGGEGGGGGGSQWRL